MPDNRNHPIDSDTLSQAARWLGGFDRDDPELNLWLAAKDDHFDTTAKRLAQLVAPTSFHNAAAGIIQSPNLDQLANIAAAS